VTLDAQPAERGGYVPSVHCSSLVMGYLQCAGREAMVIDPARLVATARMACGLAPL
jgi:hypothetical protein